MSGMPVSAKGTFRSRTTLLGWKGYHLLPSQLVVHLLLDEDDVRQVRPQADVAGGLGHAAHRHHHLQRHKHQ